MKTRWLSLSLWAIACLSAPLAIQASASDQIVVLGDSLSDSGNFTEITTVISGASLIVSPNAPRTDGTTWPVWLAENLNAKRLLPSSQNGTNFAFVGALTSGTPTNFPPGIVIPSLTVQAAQAVQAKPRIPCDSPIFVWGGGNNLLEVNPVPPNQGTHSANDIVSILQGLHKNGFDTLVTFNLPNLGRIPVTSKLIDPPAIILQGEIFNSVLSKGLAQQSFPILGIDMYALFEDVISHPSAYGFTNVTQATPSTIINPLTKEVLSLGSPTDGYLFMYDGEHPTQKTHRTIADFIYTTIRAPYFFTDLSQKAFAVSREIMTNIRQQTFAVQPCHECGVIYTFVNGDYSPLLDPPELQHSKNRSHHDGGNVTYGLTYNFNHSLMIGICGSYASHDFENRAHLMKSKTELSTNAASVFGSYQDCYGYINAAFTTSWHDFHSIRRHFKTGFASHKNQGKTHGIDYHGELSGAYLFFQPFCNLATGPLLDLNYQWVSIDGYKEKHGRIGNLQYKHFDNQIFTTGLGWEIKYYFESMCGCQPIDFVADAYLTGNRQWLEKTKHIRFRQISFGESFGEWPVEVTRRNNYVSAGLSLAADVKGLGIFNVGYNLNVGNLDIAEHVITFGVTTPIPCF